MKWISLKSYQMVVDYGSHSVPPAYYGTRKFIEPAFCINGFYEGNPPITRRFPHKELMFSSLLVRTGCWTNSPFAVDLNRHNVNVM